MNATRKQAIEELRGMVLTALGERDAAMALWFVRPRQATAAQRHRHRDPATK